MRVKDETGLDDLLLGFPGARLSCPETLHSSIHLQVGTSGLPLFVDNNNTIYLFQSSTIIYTNNSFTTYCRRQRVILK
jgi:hypothetical protein